MVTGVPAGGLVEETVGGASCGVLLVTFTIVAGEVAALLLASPGVEAVMGSMPTGSEGTVRVATPLTMVAVPRTVVPS
jgi:hypothetical protein